MGMELSIWCGENKILREKAIEKKYHMRFDKIPMELEQEYDLGKREVFDGLDKVAERILELYKKEPNNRVRFSNTFPRYMGKVEPELHDCVDLEYNCAQSLRRLYNNEFEQLKKIVIAGLDKK